MTQETGKTMVETPTDQSLILTRIFDAPRPLVYEVWTEKKHIDRWWAPRGFTVAESSRDVRPGGAWSCLMIAPDGERYPAGGVYREVVPNELLVFTHIWERADGMPGHEMVVTARFAEVEGKTRLTVEHDLFKSVESRDLHAAGWSQVFDHIAAVIVEVQEGSRDERFDES